MDVTMYTVHHAFMSWDKNVYCFILVIIRLEETLIIITYPGIICPC